MSNKKEIKDKDALIEDNEKHLKKMFDWINSQEDEKLLYYVDNVKEETKKLRILFPFFPRALKKLIREIDYPTFDNLIKKNCKKKYELLVKHKKIGKIENMLEEFKKYF
jgi:hypothetical protein